MENYNDQNVTLVVDDDDSNVFVMRSLIQGLDIDCDTTLSGFKALELVQARIAKYKEGGVK